MLQPMETSSGCALKESAAHGETMQKQVSCKELWPMGNPRWSSEFLMDWTSWEGPMLEQQ